VAGSDNVVVVGGAGFIGRHLVAALADRVRSITVVSRGVVDGHVDAAGVRYRRGDLQRLETAKRVLEGASVVYDLSKPVGATWDDFEERCLECVRNMAEASLEHGVRRAVYTSTSDAVYLGARRVVTERDGTDAKPHLRNNYSRGKAAAEKLLFEMHATRGLPAVVFRPFLVVGRGGKATHGGIGQWAAPNCLLGWGRGDNPQPFVLVTDVADAMVSAMDASGVEGEAFNLAGDVFLSARDYVGLLAESSKRNFRYFPRNLWRLWLMAFATGSLKRLVGRIEERTSYRDMVSSSKQSTIDCSLAKHVLGWKPNANLEVFRAVAIDSYFEEIPPGDLRLEA
jgi:nucleoside-diphosphate-sugar epimerase